MLGTINKIEFTLGYFPKNASAGDLLPFADVLKKEIRAIGMSYELPDKIIFAKASGSVWAKTQEQEWGISEAEMDDILSSVGADYALPEGYSGISPAKLKVFKQKLDSSGHKRVFYPIFYR